MGLPLDRGERRGTFTFGSSLLCTKDEGARIAVERVRFETTPERGPDFRVTSWFRSVPVGTDAMGSLPVGPHHVDANVTRSLEEPVTAACDENGAADSTRPMTELLTVVTTGRAGGAVTRTFIDYRVGGTRYTLPIDWQVGICGSAVTDRELCDRGIAPPSPGPG